MDPLLQALLGLDNSGQVARLQLEVVNLRRQLAERDARLETMKRKSQYLIDVAWNRALDECPVNAPDEASIAHLRRPVRHQEEFGKK